ncbi:TonB-dependent receptor domain-containing protein [Sediminibacterium sp.]|uniref:TonB-dependent receptor domain-containing protein n=1 Tax=Sediminibacterium sp. TaxID=1917865 RepID=UPI003F73123C
MFIKSAIFFWVLLINFSSLTAQNAVLKGVVIDNKSRNPIEFASVSILTEVDSSVIAGFLTQKNGTFYFSKLSEGKFLLKVVSLGSRTIFLPFTIQQKSQQLHLDSILLSTANDSLGEVIVTGKVNNNFSYKLDKQTFKANQFETARGGTATDILKNLPSVAVNGAGEISVRGSTGFLVLINGKPVLTDAQTILSQLPANTIDGIELITAPSAKYDSDGRSGIINITTKKGVADGFELQANALGGLPSTTDYNNLEKPIRFGGDFTLSFKKDKLDISVGANYNRNDANGSREGDVYTINDVNRTITRFPSIGERSFDRYNYGLRTAINFTPNQSNSINIGFFKSRKYQQRRADLVYNNSVENSTNGTIISQFPYFNSNVQNKEGEFLVGSFDYVHTFKSKSKISSSFIYEKANLYGNTFNQNVDLVSKSIPFQLVTNPYQNPIEGYRFKLDYSTSIGAGKFEAGYQFRKDQQDGKFDYAVTPFFNQPDILKFRGTAKSINNINSVYAQYGGKISKLQYTTGLRFEQANREVVLSSEINPHLLKMRNLFPSLNLLYTFNNNWNAKAGYSKRIQRNNSFELNPIPEREHSETLEQGDPDLLPQIIDLMEMGINYNFSRGTFFATVYFQDIQNPVQRVNSVYTDTILNRVFTNVNRARLVGIEMGTNIKLTQWYNFYFGANMYNYKIIGGLNILGSTSFVNNSNWVFSINQNNSFNLGRNWNLQTNVNYLSARPTAQGEDSRFLSVNSSVKKTILNGRLSIGLQWQNMSLGFMNTNQQRITTSGKNFYTTTNYIYETDVLLINFGFNINKLTNKPKLPISEISEREF